MEWNRRQWLSAAGALSVGSLVAAEEFRTGSADAARKDRFRLCLNTSTLRGHELPLTEEIAIAAEAGYDGIEPWIREIERYRDDGGSLDDLRKRIADAGLQVESAIGFARWIVDDEAERQAGIEQFKRDMELVRAIGGTRIAAPPVGAHGGDAAQLDLSAVAERYAAILEVGANIGVVPQLEIWGPSKNLSRLGEAAFVAVECGRADAGLLPDIYHIYRGGSSFAGLNLLSGDAIHVFHVNDYPGRPREQLSDADRVYPGDGAAPISEIMHTLASIGFHGALSLELFNRDYWQQDPREVARTGLEKMQAALS